MSKGLTPEAEPYIDSDETSAILNLHLAALGIQRSTPASSAPTTAGGGGDKATNNTSKGKAAAKGAGGAVSAGASSKPTSTKAKGLSSKPVAAQPILDPDAPLTSDASVTRPGGPAGEEKFYITTAINYTNGSPHMGHAYEAITSDVIARYHRMYGRQTFFLTGTDEHGQKIANAAEGIGIKPIDICDKYAEAFQILNRLLRISNDFYIRTTMPQHHLNAQELWKRCSAAGDIYLSVYEGWYNVREETFVSELEAKTSDYKDPTSGVPLRKMEEKSYFFRMSKYKQALLDHIKASPSFILPESGRNSILARLEEDLLDLSISRTSFDWGIPVPEGFEANHVLYVWFDALSNYLSGVHGLEPDHPLSKFWPANVHVIGKDIIWFHCVIWPTMLMSAGLPLPHSVFAHGFINGKDGRKMSKSLGNVGDPHEMIAKFPIDTLRYYLIKDPFGGDINFNEENLVAAHNNELADVLGNLVHRAVNLSHKFCDGVVAEVGPEGWGSWTPPFDLGAMRSKIKTAMETHSLKVMSDEVMGAVRDTNKFLTDAEPWKMKGEEKADDRRRVVRLTLEAIYILAHFLAPIMPYTATAILKKLGTPARPIPTLQTNFMNLTPGTSIEIGEILFVKIETTDGGEGAGEEGSASTGTTTTKLGPDGKPPRPPADKQQKKEMGGDGGGKKEKGGGGKGKAAEEEPDQPDFSKIEIKVGKIVKVWHHPSADRLFCEEIDVGEEKPRQIASGLREHYTLEQMENRKVCVVTNLKAAKLAGFESQGMVLAASLSTSEGEAKGKVELIEVPEGAAVGERIGLANNASILTYLPFAPEKVKKKKVWEGLVNDLKTEGEGGVVTYKGVPLTTSAGPLFAPTVCGGDVR